MVSRISSCLLLAVGVLLCGHSRSEAQTDYSPRGATSMLSVGLGFAGGASTSIEAPDTWKLDPFNFAYRWGLDVSYPLTSTISATMELGADSRATTLYWYQDKTVWESRRVDYFSITPGFRFSAFFLGMNFGIPVKGVRSWQNTSDAPGRKIEMDVDTENLLTMIEPRLGVVVPVLDEEIGWLGITFTSGYNLSNISDKEDFLPGPPRKEALGSQTVSLHLGLTWQFGIPGTGRKQ
jgi:hypothetical protein